MALVVWDESYSVKVRQFDEQHKKLIGIVNRLHDAMRNGKGAQILFDVLTSLAAHTQAHFSDEERLMRIYSYPGFVHHKKQHDLLVEKVRKYQADAQANQGVITMDLMTFLKDWLLQHIQGEDVKYGPYLLQKGVA